MGNTLWGMHEDVPGDLTLAAEGSRLLALSGQSYPAPDWKQLPYMGG